MIDLGIIPSLVGLLAGGVTSYMALKKRSDEVMNIAIDNKLAAYDKAFNIKLSEHERGDLEQHTKIVLDVQDLKNNVNHLSNTTVRKEDIAELKADVKNALSRLNELIQLIQSHQKP